MSGTAVLNHLGALAEAADLIEMAVQEEKRDFERYQRAMIARLCRLGLAEEVATQVVRAEPEWPES